MADNNMYNQVPNSNSPQRNNQSKVSPKKYKPIYKRVWFWFIILFEIIYLSSCAAIMSSSNDTDTNEPTTEIEVKTTQQQTEATTYKKPETTTHKIVATTQKKVEKKKDDVRDVEKATVKKNFYTVGETAKQAGISMKFKKAIVSHGDFDGFVRPDKGKEYVICVFKVKNKSDEKISMSWAEFEAYIDNRSIDEDVWGLQCEDAKKYGDFSGEVSPGKTLEGCVVYEVKKGWKKLEMRTDLGFGFFHKKEVIFKVKNK